MQMNITNSPSLVRSESEIVSPEVTSGNEKCGAGVPREIIVEVTAIL